MSAAFRRLAVRTVLALGSLILLVWGILHLRVLAANVHATWTYNYVPEPACSAIHATNCIDHFEVLDITGKDPVVITSVPNPSPASGRVDNISVAFKYGPPFGQRTFSVIAVGKDPKGNRVSSNPYAARASAWVRPGATVSTILK